MAYLELVDFSAVEQAQEKAERRRLRLRRRQEADERAEAEVAAAEAPAAAPGVTRLCCVLCSIAAVIGSPLRIVQAPYPTRVMPTIASTAMSARIRRIAWG